MTIIYDGSVNQMVSARIEELSQQFKTVDVGDKVALMTWLKAMFEACAAEPIEAPGKDQVAARIGRAHYVIPNPLLSPIVPVDAQERTRWVQTLCITALVNTIALILLNVETKESDYRGHAWRWWAGASIGLS